MRKYERPMWQKMLVRTLVVLVVIGMFGIVVSLGESYPMTTLCVLLVSWFTGYKLYMGGE